MCQLGRLTSHENIAGGEVAHAQDGALGTESGLVLTLHANVKVERCIALSVAATDGISLVTMNT